MIENSQQVGSCVFGRATTHVLGAFALQFLAGVEKSSVISSKEPHDRKSRGRRHGK